MRPAAKVVAFVILATLALVSGAKTSREQDRACEVIAQALMDHAKLKVGMTRAEVEKTFLRSGGMTFRLTTRYEYQKCEYIHADIEFEADSKSASDFSPNDVVTKIGPLYLRYPARD